MVRVDCVEIVSGPSADHTVSESVDKNSRMSVTIARYLELVHACQNLNRAHRKPALRKQLVIVWLFTDFQLMETILVASKALIRVLTSNTFEFLSSFPSLMAVSSGLSHFD